MSEAGVVPPAEAEAAAPDAAAQYPEIADDVHGSDAGERSSTSSSREPRDWEWVEEWRASAEPVPWGLGLTVAVFAAIVVGSAVFVVSSGLSDRPVLAIAVDVAVAGGVFPAIWLSRGLPVLRWLSLGAVLGIVGAWVSALVFLL